MSTNKPGIFHQTMYVVGLVLGGVFGYRFGNQMSGALLGVVFAIIGAITCSSLVGYVAVKIFGYKP